MGVKLIQNLYFFNQTIMSNWFDYFFFNLLSTFPTMQTKFTVIGWKYTYWNQLKTCDKTMCFHFPIQLLLSPFSSGMFPLLLLSPISSSFFILFLLLHFLPIIFFEFFFSKNHIFFLVFQHFIRIVVWMFFQNYIFFLLLIIFFVCFVSIFFLKMISLGLSFFSRRWFYNTSKAFIDSCKLNDLFDSLFTLFYL